MAGWGSKETDTLRTNIESQLNRLLAQLQDLDDLKEELDDDEIADIRADTLEQMQEFEASLSRLMSGDVTLVDSLGSMRLAIQAAISKAFKTPEVIKMFAKKDSGQLRGRLNAINMNVKLGKTTKEQGTLEAVEVLTALKKLGEKLSSDEMSFLQQNRTAVMAEFDRVSEEGIGSGARNKILSSAATQIKRANA
eukprot:m51a1_g2954 putative protein lzic isoform x2 (194) ;mRNA; f:649573-650444